MIQKVEEVRSELQGKPLRNHRILIDCEVPLFKGWTVKRVPSQIAIMTSAWDAIRSKTGELSGRFCAWHSKRAQLEIVVRIAFFINDRSHNVRPVKSVTASAVVILEVVVQGEGLSTLQSNRAISSPATTEALP